MSDRYEPQSDFLRAVIADEAPLTGGELAEANLRLLIKMTSDADLSNRDWATFLLSQEDTDTEAVRAALIRAAQDENEFVRAEAVLGLAKRDPTLALPLVQNALKADSVACPMFQAAEYCAHPSLVDDLRRWTKPSGEPFLDSCAADALAACESGVRPDI
ncbi:HEAT repeat domain-containing protein [uncultured Roseibium sp.]|uniref:HEAT repeat domain-containing protein n=1 Tax=uncultured Roseibium sp. TaxID=1936171 RepID=UPI0032171FB7